MIYKAITSNGNTDLYIDNQLVYKCITNKYLFKDIFYIEDACGLKVLELKIRHIFGFSKKYLIMNQRLDKHVVLFKIKSKLCLKVEEDIISLEKKFRAWKYEGDFIVNDNFFGDFKNKLSFFESSFTFNFKNDSDIKDYCIVLFSILVIDEFNTRSAI